MALIRPNELAQALVLQGSTGGEALAKVLGMSAETNQVKEIAASKPPSTVPPPAPKGPPPNKSVPDE